jgi:hypothetical protein
MSGAGGAAPVGVRGPGLRRGDGKLCLPFMPGAARYGRVNLHAPLRRNIVPGLKKGRICFVIPAKAGMRPYIQTIPQNFVRMPMFSK